MALRLAPNVANYIAVDVSASMLDYARGELCKYSRPSLRFEFADANYLEMPGQSYSVIIARNILHLLEDIERSIDSFADLLRPGGLLISKTPCVGDMNSLARSARVYFDRVFNGAQGVYQDLSEKLIIETMVRSGLVIKEVAKLSENRLDISPYIISRKECL